MVATHHLGVVDLVVGELHLNAFGIPHDMVIGYDITILADDKARPKAFVLFILRSTEKIIEKRRQFKKRLNGHFFADCRDVDHTGGYLLGYHAESLLCGENITRNIFDRSLGLASLAFRLKKKR